jgi:8-oxo-dGTP diphosphatase
MKRVVAALLLRGVPDALGVCEPAWSGAAGAPGTGAIGRGEVLICQRRTDQFMPLKWEFPGGKIEPGESPEMALRRELQEELGIQAEIGRNVTTLRHVYPNGGELELQFFVVEKFAGEITNFIFHDVRWEKLDNLPQYEFLEADRLLVRDLAAGKAL